METTTNITILGSTGSIGTQTLDIIRTYPDRFKAVALTACNNWELLARQALEFKPLRVVIANEAHLNNLRNALSATDIEVVAGDAAVAEAAAMPQSDTVVTAMVGYSGLVPTIHAIGAGKKIALANKETLVVAGELIKKLIGQTQSEIIPVDSEHSAIFQCLVGEERDSMSKIILTASGGPFRKFSKDDLRNVTPEDALRHPNWDMGAKVTIDSASMMNKGFEMIEARWLFDCKPEDIEIVVHPQSIVHSMVEFTDGAVKAQLGQPDMHIPIGYALAYPKRLPATDKHLNVTDYSQLTFEKPDYDKFPLLKMAFEAIAEGGTATCILNAANEVAVAAFLNKKIRFTDMPLIVAETLEKVHLSRDVSLENLIATNKEAVKTALEQLPKYKY